MGNPIKIDDLGVPLFQETLIFQEDLGWTGRHNVSWGQVIVLICRAYLQATLACFTKNH